VPLSDTFATASSFERVQCSNCYLPSYLPASNLTLTYFPASK
jgi:hypothetical protein